MAVVDLGVNVSTTGSASNRFHLNRPAMFDGPRSLWIAEANSAEGWYGTSPDSPFIFGAVTVDAALHLNTKHQASTTYVRAQMPAEPGHFGFS